MRDRRASIHKPAQPTLMKWLIEGRLPEPASWQMASRIFSSCHRILNLISYNVTNP